MTTAPVHVDEQWYGSLRDLRALLDAGYFGPYQDAALTEGGGLYMECPLAPGSEHIVHSFELRADHAEFTCSAGCDEAAIRRRLLDAQALAASAELDPREEELAPATTWAPVDLAAVLAQGALDEPPALLMRSDGARLLYRGRVHVLSGEPESGKGWLALHASAERLKVGESVLYLDFEDTAASIVRRLLNLGVEEGIIANRFHYVRPDVPIDDRGWADLAPALATAPTLAVIDGLTEALTVHGFDLLDNTDIARWLGLVPRPLVDAGAAVLQVDHVGRDREARGRFAIGAQHKLAGVDAHYGLDVLEPFGRGRDGRVKVVVQKDRPGHVRQHADDAGRVAELRLTSRAEGAIGVELAPPAAVDTFRPTWLMEQIARAVEDTPGLSKNAIRARVPGRNEYKDLALELLVAEGNIEARHEGQAHRHFPGRPYLADEDEDR